MLTCSSCRNDYREPYILQQEAVGDIWSGQTSTTLSLRRPQFVSSVKVKVSVTSKCVHFKRYHNINPNHVVYLKTYTGSLLA